jgi:urea carboxylase-associated protein 2
MGEFFMPELLWEELLPGGATWSHVLKRGTALRLVDLEGGANVGAIFHNYENLVERYNMPDTLKAQHTAHLTAGHAIYSDMGRVLLSITADSLGWHDPLGGAGDASLVARKYGEARYQEYRNAYHKNAKDSFLVELSKYGLGPRDLTANVNFFSKVVVDADGALGFQGGHSAPGSFVELRAEMNTLVILTALQHPMDPDVQYHPKPVQLQIKTALPVAADDVCRLRCAENGRGFTLTERYFL